jgi:hypothetical protein
MSVDLKLVDELRKRANVSYQEAVDALEKCDNNLLDALVYLEKENKIKAENKCCSNGFFSWVKELIKKGNRIKFIISKEDNKVLSIPLTLAILITIFAPYITVLGLAIALITKHNIKFKKDSGEETSINKVFQNISDNIK